MNEQFPRRLLRALGQRIRELRTERGYSQEGFADRCGVHRTFMGTVERGESNLSFENIFKVTAALGIPLSVLFADLEQRAEIAAEPAPAAGLAAKPKKRTMKKQA